MFAPKAVALIGATEEPGSVGRAVFENLLASDFGGPVFAVNSRHNTVLGHKTFARIGDVPAKVDLAVVATPADTVPGVIAECAQAGVAGAVILSAGFRERGDNGRELERQILTNAASASLRIVGPNCLGIMLPHTGLNATFAASMARPGSVAFISQSGRALYGRTRLESSRKRRIQRLHLRRLHGRHRLGRSHLLAWR
jgi:acetyltransferase